MAFLILLNFITYIISSKLELVIDVLFKDYLESSDLLWDTCSLYDNNSFYYRGRPTNIKDILESTDINNYDEYKYVYIPEKKYLSNVTLFPKSTIFYALEGFNTNSSDYNIDYCIIRFYIDLERYKLYYIIIGRVGYLEKNDVLPLNYILLAILFGFFFMYFFRFLYLKSSHAIIDSFNVIRFFSIFSGNALILVFSYYIYLFFFYKSCLFFN